MSVVLQNNCAESAYEDIGLQGSRTKVAVRVSRKFRRFLQGMINAGLLWNDKIFASLTCMIRLTATRRIRRRG